MPLRPGVLSSEACDGFYSHEFTGADAASRVGPARYDAGMRALTLGRVEEMRDALAQAVVPSPGARVLEIGCGTGALTEKLIVRGAKVTAVDQNPEMMERARTRLAHASPDTVTFVERTASGIDAFPQGSFDAAVASLSLSEISQRERAFCTQVRRARPSAGRRDRDCRRGTTARAVSVACCRQSCVGRKPLSAG